MCENHCPDCGATIGQPHQNDCDVERCGKCGQQRISCGCDNIGEPHAVWIGDFPTARKRIVVEETGVGVYSRRFVLEAPVDFDLSELWVQEVTDMADDAGVPWVYEDVISEGTQELNEPPLPDDPIVHVESNPWGKVWEEED